MALLSLILIAIGSIGLLAGLIGLAIARYGGQRVQRYSALVGFPIEGYGPAKSAADSLGKHGAGRNIALFITHAAPEDSPDLPGWLGNCRAAAAQASLVSVFDCQGELSEQVADFMTKSNDEAPIAWARDRPSTIGQPDAERLERARVFAREIMEEYSG